MAALVVVGAVSPGYLTKCHRFKPRTVRDPRSVGPRAVRTGRYNSLVPFGVVMAGLAAVRGGGSQLGNVSERRDAAGV